MIVSMEEKASVNGNYSHDMEDQHSLRIRKLDLQWCFKTTVLKHLPDSTGNPLPVIICPCGSVNFTLKSASVKTNTSNNSEYRIVRFKHKKYNGLHTMLRLKIASISALNIVIMHPFTFPHN